MRYNTLRTLSLPALRLNARYRLHLTHRFKYIMADNDRSNVRATIASIFPCLQMELVLTSPGLLHCSKSHSQRLCGERQIHQSRWHANLYVPHSPPGSFPSSHSYILSDVTGPSSATTGLLFVYDIFGLSPQAKQGADILAYTDPSHEYLVFAPDFLRGQPANHDLFPPDTEEKRQKMKELFEGPANIPKTAEIIPATIKEIAKQAPQVENWGAVGFCWGGKVG